MKKLISLILLSTFIFVPIIGATVFSAALGDVNNDGEVDNKDVVVLFRYLSGGTEQIAEDAADVNQDGGLNNKDVTTLFRCLANNETPGDAIEYAKEFTVSRAIGKDMVIQRNEPIRIWGWAPESEEGKYVKAEFSGLSGKAKIVNGEWTITLNGMLPANTTPENIRIYGDGAETIIKDVLVGDVYWLVGQSNVWYPLSHLLTDEPNACEEAKNVEIGADLQIRLNRTTAGDFAGITLGTNDVSEDVVNRRGWQNPKKGAKLFSALGYYIAYNLYNKFERKVPIGMIEFDGNGMALHGFLPNEVRDALNVSTVDANGIYSAAGSNAHPSSYMYNHGMYAFQRLPITAIIWYQGESDCQTANNNCYAYAERFTALINYLRDKHNLNNHDYPVYIVELPPIYINFDFATVRANMGSIPSMLKNAHICSTSDLWKDKNYGYDLSGNMDPTWNNLHPYNKYEVAARMTDIILAETYETGNIAAAEGPIVTSCEFSADGKTATIKFTNVGDGLKWYGDVKKGIRTLEGFSWTDPASIEITAPDTLVIKTNKAIKRVVYNIVRDNSFPETVTLCNSNDIPCAAWMFTR